MIRVGYTKDNKNWKTWKTKTATVNWYYYSIWLYHDASMWKKNKFCKSTWRDD